MKMTQLERPVKRMTSTELDGSYGIDKHKKLVVCLRNGPKGAVIEMWPARTRRKEVIELALVFKYALRNRVNGELLEVARKKKEKKKERLARRARAERDRRFSKKIKETNGKAH